MGCESSVPNVIPQAKVLDTETIVKKSHRTRSSLVQMKQLSSLTENFKILRTLGSSELGTLFHAIEKHSQTECIIREFSKTFYDSTELLFHEVKILKDLDHPNILKVNEIVESPRRYYISMEYIKGGNLKSRILKTGNEEQVSKYMQDIFEALNYIHLQGIVHCDLSLNHILLSSPTDPCIPKILGFSFAQRIHAIRDFDVKLISYHYASPEMLEGNFDTKTDL